ncbi:MAG TPA: hypothetical protein VG733_03490 [Chthoniobacteraceae bacterium]|nr:hypothetical protein [Chthoniobacteraceae bacterium]
MLLQKVNREPQKPSSGALKVGIYILLLIGAYMLGRFQGSSPAPAPAPVAASDTATPTPAPMAPSEAANDVPLATPAEAAHPSASAPLITTPLVASSTPVRVEKATPVVPAPTSLSPGAGSFPGKGPAPVPIAAASPVKQTNQVTITQAIQIPVKNDAGRITGYINLQKGQLVTPAEVDNDQIKIKTGTNSFVMVPVTSTDMAH